MWPQSRVFLLCLLVVCLVSVSSSGSSAVKADDAGARSAMERIVRAAGGAAALRAVTAIRAEGKIAAFARRDSGRYERVWARGGRLRVETTYKRSTELRLLNGTHGWRGAGEQSLEDARGPRLQAMLYQYLVLDLPFGIAEGRYRLAFFGTDSFRGVEVDVYRLIEPSSPEVFVYVDGEGHVVKSLGRFTVGSGPDTVSTTLSARFSDFRPVDGLVLPYKVTYFARGMRIARANIKTYKLNPDISQVRFEPVR